MNGKLSTIVALCLSLTSGGAVGCQNAAETPAETAKPSKVKKPLFCSLKHSSRATLKVSLPQVLQSFASLR